MSILKFKTLEEVAQRANKSKFGLAAGVWSQNVDTCNTLARNLRAGKESIVFFLKALFFLFFDFTLYYFLFCYLI